MKKASMYWGHSHTINPSHSRGDLNQIAVLFVGQSLRHTVICRLSISNVLSGPCHTGFILLPYWYGYMLC